MESPERVTEPTISGRGLSVMAGLGHRLQIVPIEHQPDVAAMRATMIDDGRESAAAAFAERVPHEIGFAQVSPAAQIIERRRAVFTPRGAAI
jgi:hypothetical protein